MAVNAYNSATALVKPVCLSSVYTVRVGEVSTLYTYTISLKNVQTLLQTLGFS